LADWREHKAQSDAYIQAVRQRQQEWHDKVAAEEQARQDRDRDANAERNRRRAEQHASLQAAQMAWGARRRELQAELDELKARVAGAQGTVDRGAVDDAVRAAGELAVYQRRLALAEENFKIFLRSAP
jgi:hypothetical protein